MMYLNRKAPRYLGAGAYLVVIGRTLLARLRAMFRAIGVPYVMDYRLEESHKSIFGELLSADVATANILARVRRGAPSGAGAALAVDAEVVSDTGLSYMPYWTAGMEKGLRKDISYVEYGEVQRRSWQSGYEVVAYDGGALLEFRAKDKRPTVAKLGAEMVRKHRGRISNFSNRSRTRLMRELNRVRRVEFSAAYMLTLTYPFSFPSVRQSKRDLKVFLQRLKRQYPGAGGIWKLEPQRRGAPHYHLLVFGVGQNGARRAFVREFRAWVKLAWFEVVGSGDIKHYRAGTEFSPVRNYQDVQRYAAKKYFAKSDFSFEDEAPGRHWGTFGDLGKYKGEAVVFDVTRSQAVQWWRVLDKLRYAVARAGVDRNSKAWVIRRARRRRSNGGSRWYIGSTELLMRYFLDGLVREARE